MTGNVIPGWEERLEALGITFFTGSGLNIQSTVYSNEEYLEGDSAFGRVFKPKGSDPMGTIGRHVFGSAQAICME